MEYTNLGNTGFVISAEEGGAVGDDEVLPGI